MADHDGSLAGPAAPGENGQRRQFLKWLSGGFLSLWALGGAGALAAYLKAPERSEASAARMVSIGRLEDLRVGEARLIQHGITPFYVLRLDAARVVAMSAVCTHFGCITQWHPEADLIECPCHGSHYEKNGTVVHGPAPRALPHFSLRLMPDGTLLVDTLDIVKQSQLLKV